VARLLSVNVGMPRDVAWKGRTVHTGVWKAARSRGSGWPGARHRRRGQGDLVGHGGEQRAVFVYQIESYRYWEHESVAPTSAWGQFGDNLTVDGSPTTRSASETATASATPIRGQSTPGHLLPGGIRMDEPRMAALLVAHHRPGFYFR